MLHARPCQVGGQGLKLAAKPPDGIPRQGSYGVVVEVKNAGSPVDGRQVGLGTDFRFVQRALAATAPSRSGEYLPDGLPPGQGPFLGEPSDLAYMVWRGACACGCRRNPVGIRCQDVAPVHIVVSLGNVAGVVHHHRVVAVGGVDAFVKIPAEFVFAEELFLHRFIQDEVGGQA